MNIKYFYKKFILGKKISIDSRKISSNCVFFSINGKKYNGNLFAEEAIKNGAYFAFVNNIKYQNIRKNILYIKDTINSIQQLANYYRNNIIKSRVIAITGSNGKTTTKNLIRNILSMSFKVHATYGNQNNHIGLPLTILSAPIDTQILILEMGASKIKEIELLCSIAEPDYGYITNFGNAHIGKFGNLENIIITKLELFKYLRINKKKIFLNINDDIQKKNSFGINKYIFSKGFNIKSNIYIKMTYNNYNKLTIIYKKEKIYPNIIGIYNFYNIASSIAIGNYFGISAKKIKIAIEKYNSYNRSQIIKLNKLNIILDAYNANPNSMIYSLLTLKNIKGNISVILGDMLDLGSFSYKYHKKIINFLLKTRINNIILVGFFFNECFIKNKKFKFFKKKYEIENFLEKKNITGTLLIKGSRKMKLETIVKKIYYKKIINN